MINCIIVDDEQHAIELIIDYLKSIGSIQIKATFNNPIKALNFLTTNTVDLIILDIHMPELSGIEFIQTLNNLHTMVVLTTGDTKFAATAFDLHVADYLLKPISLTRFLQAITKVQKMINTSKIDVKPSVYEDFFMIKTEAKGKMLKINIAEIDFVEGMKNYVAFHHNGSRTLALLSMKDVEDRLPQTQFIRVQKSFIVALKKIISVDGNKIILKGVDTEILIGETYRKDFLEIMQRKLIS
ncbi:LytR/AlgR family response regulator transcription factor [Pedobacter sp. GSP4]|uniref:LytR/AlgR family response regulator transcription factor n=1 Tax=Pedobacter sp. GSP4 TaxID=3453716 RepID=UPI003EED3E19